MTVGVSPDGVLTIGVSPATRPGQTGG
jgi:hypothetical protein